jgi:CarD family transcriptional regulator, regulator of rRNA transcription
MQFSIGDKVVHPLHGPGVIAGLESRESVDGLKSYYVINIPGQGLTLHVPVQTADELGIRPVMPQSMLPQVLSTLGGEPSVLPDDFKVRQGQLDADFRSGEVLPLARIVRDLTWHGRRAHLTKRDSDLLKHGQERLAAEMALSSGDKASDSIRLIGSTMNVALAGASG